MSSAFCKPDRDHDWMTLKVHVVTAFLLLSVVLIAHGGSLRGGFVFDDEGSITDNRSIHSFSSLNNVLWGGKYTTVAGRPLLNLSLALNYAVGGVRPEGYHLVNYVIHAAVALALFALLRRVFAGYGETKNAAGPLALTISLLWCIHPLTINGVSYIVQRAEAMASGFYLVALWAFVKGAQTSRQRWIVVSIVSAWMGALTKEIIATVPLAVIALDSLLVTRDWRMALRRHWWAYLGLMSAWLPLGFCMWSSRNRAGTVGFDMGVTLSEHIQTQLWAFARYLQLAVWPHPLVFDYGDRFVVSDPAQLLTAGIVVAAYSALVGWLLVRRSPLAFPVVTLCFLLAPTLVIPIVTQTVAEHRMYLASACVIVLVVVPLYLMMSRLPRPSSASRTTQTFRYGIVLVPVTTILFLTTFWHTRAFSSSELLWTDTMQKRPESQRAVYNVALAKFHAKADLDVVLKLFDQVIAMPGKYVAEAYDERGRVWLLKGESSKAMDDFTRALMMYPDSSKFAVVRAYEHRGRLLAQQGELSKALEDFDHAITLRPKAIEYYQQRAIILRDLGRHEDALRDLDKADEIESSNITTGLVRGSVEIARGELTRALASFDQILAHAPNHPVARRSRAGVYARLHRWSEARQEILSLQQQGRRVDEKLVHDVEQHFANLQHDAM